MRIKQNKQKKSSELKNKNYESIIESNSGLGYE